MSAYVYFDHKDFKWPKLFIWDSQWGTHKKKVLKLTSVLIHISNISRIHYTYFSSIYNSFKLGHGNRHKQADRFKLWHELLAIRLDGQIPNEKTTLWIYRITYSVDDSDRELIKQPHRLLTLVRQSIMSGQIYRSTNCRI